jgi:DNA-binding NtrC family response regulator
MSRDLYPEFPIVIVDDEAVIVEGVLAILGSEGITNVAGFQDASEAAAYIAGRDIGIVLVDLVMPGMGGLELITRLRLEKPEILTAVITGNHEIETAVQCMRAGADDYLTKPVDANRLVATLRRLIEKRELQLENQRMRDKMLAPCAGRPAAFDAVLTCDPAMEGLMGYAEAIAPTPYPVLITGETGTGKELFARAIHDLSGRGGAFMAVNAAGLDDAFFSDALFGHRAGAFTGAAKALDGLVEKARNGTLFLDEIGDLALASQVKLLRVMETGEYYPLGSDFMKRSNARMIVATNRDLAGEVAEGRFRKDLFYRLKAHHLHIPPLRERPGDIPLLVEDFLRSAALECGRPLPELPEKLFVLLSTYGFPGNVRELETMVLDAFSRCRGRSLPLRPFEEAMGSEGRAAPREYADLSFPRILPTIRRATERLVEEALRRSEGNQALAARLLGISPQALGKRLKKGSKKASLSDK